MAEIAEAVRVRFGVTVNVVSRPMNIVDLIGDATTGEYDKGREHSHLQCRSSQH